MSNTDKELMLVEVKMYEDKLFLSDGSIWIIDTVDMYKIVDWIPTDSVHIQKLQIVKKMRYLNTQ